MLKIAPSPSKDFEALFAKLQPRLEELWKKEHRMITGELVVIAAEIQGRDPKITNFQITFAVKTGFAGGIAHQFVSLAVLRKPDIELDIDSTIDKIIARAAAFFSMLKGGTQASIVPNGGTGLDRSRFFSPDFNVKLIYAS